MNEMMQFTYDDSINLDVICCLYLMKFKNDEQTKQLEKKLQYMIDNYCYVTKDDI